MQEKTQENAGPITSKAATTVCAVIPARAGSKGVPGKNLRTLAGLPLLAHSIQHALSAHCVDRVVVSTDCEKIAQVALDYGAEVPFLRPAALACDDSAVMDAVEHLLDNLSGATPSHIALLQPTSPLRAVRDIDAAFDKMLKGRAKAVVSVCEASSHPLLCRTLDGAGRLKPFIESELNAARRQELPAAYVLNGALYLIRAETLRQERSWCPEGTISYRMPEERSVDIDTEFDFQWAEWLMLARKEQCAA